MKHFILLCLLCLSCISIAAAELKVALVDMRTVFRDYEKTKVVEKKLQEQMDTFRDYSKKLAAQIQTLKKEFETVRDQSQNNFALTPAEQQNKKMKARELYERLAIKDAELKNYAKSRQEQIRTAYEKMRTEILNVIRVVVSAQAQLQGFHLVLDSSGATSNDISPVIYFTPSLDITKQVLENLNRDYKAKAKSN